MVDLNKKNAVEIRLEPIALDVHDAVKVLGISERLLWSKTKDGTIPHFKIGKRILYPVRELRDWASKQIKDNHN